MPENALLACHVLTKPAGVSAAQQAVDITMCHRLVTSTYIILTAFLNISVASMYDALSPRMRPDRQMPRGTWALSRTSSLKTDPTASLSVTYAKLSKRGCKGISSPS